MKRARSVVAALAVSAAALGLWIESEGWAPEAEIPTKGDVPTIGHGSTRYEDGTPVKMGDKITRPRAAELALNLMSADERIFNASLPPDARLYPEEKKVYLNFTGQYGIGNWRASSMRTNIIKGDYVAACKALLRYRFAAKYDCSTLVNGRPNKRCWGVWQRQKDRYTSCMEAQ